MRRTLARVRVSSRSEAAVARAAAGGRLAGHQHVVAGDLRLRQQLVVDGDLADGALEPGVHRHRAHVQRAGAGGRHDVVLAEATGLAVARLVPRHAVEPDVDRARILRGVLTAGRLAERRVLADHVVPLPRLDQAARWLPVGARTEAGAVVEDVGGEPVAAVLRVGRVVKARFPFARGAVVLTLAHPVDVAAAVVRELQRVGTYPRLPGEAVRGRDRER